MGALILFFLFFLIVAYRLCLMYVREDNDSNVKSVITRFIWTICTLLSTVPREAVKFARSLTHCPRKAVKLKPSLTQSRHC